MSIYQNVTTAQREALAKARKVGEEVPKCAAYFDHEARCDLRRSHSCAPDPVAVAMQQLMNGADSVTVRR